MEFPRLSENDILDGGGAGSSKPSLPFPPPLALNLRPAQSAGLGRGGGIVPGSCPEFEPRALLRMLWELRRCSPRYSAAPLRCVGLKSGRVCGISMQGICLGATLGLYMICMGVLEAALRSWRR
eukprot:9393166-Pyramimonas_sp.AAC.1